MPEKRHPSSTTNAALRRRIQSSSEPSTVLAARYGINRKTIDKWRKRDTVEDAPRGRPQAHGSKTLTLEEQAVIVGFRRLSRLPLDDCLYALHDRFPDLTRSTLYRCLRRFGMHKFASDAQPARRGALAAIGVFRLNIGRASTGNGMMFVFAAADPESRIICTLPYEKADERAAAQFLRELAAEIPYRIHTVETNGELPFTRAAGKARGLFDKVCAEHGMAHRLIPADRNWTRIQAQWIASVHPRPRFATDAALREHLIEISRDHNFKKKLKSLGGLTPVQFLCRAWAAHPDMFHRLPADPGGLAR